MPRPPLGQHFLVDHGVINDIVQAIAPDSGDDILEIGPGKGALTSPLLSSGAKVHAVEIDPLLAAALRDRLGAAESSLSVSCTDILSVDMGKLAMGTRVVGNIPYQITSPLLLRLAGASGLIKDVHVMIQKEVADRVCAKPGTKAYGRLSVVLQYFFETAELFDVPASSFDPPPKVESAVIAMRPRPPDTVASDPALFQEIVRLSFNKRRKKLSNALAPALAGFSGEIPVDLSRRGETLSVSEFVCLANALSATESPGTRGT